MSSYVLTIFLFDEALAGLTFFSIKNIGSTTAEPKAPSLICLDKVYCEALASNQGSRYNFQSHTYYLWPTGEELEG